MKVILQFSEGSFNFFDPLHGSHYSTSGLLKDEAIAFAKKNFGVYNLEKIIDKLRQTTPTQAMTLGLNHEGKETEKETKVWEIEFESKIDTRVATTGRTNARSSFKR